jgi:thiosulfate/3-mercaptopyruvate sulfurtransferase
MAVMASSSAPSSPLVSVTELHALLGRPGAVTVLDVRYRVGQPDGRAEHARGHVPGAAYVDLDRDLAAPPGPGGRHPLPEAEAFEEAMRRLGVRDDRPVVVYDDWGSLAAGRAWWLLRHHGHRDVRVLDGAWPAWVAAGGEVHTGAVLPARGDFTARPGGMPVVEAEDLLGVPVIVDARAPERFRGEVEPIDPVAGHIPGAVNLFWKDGLTAEGRFRSAKGQRRRFSESPAAAKLSDADEIIVYCGSGVSACPNVLALTEAGYSNVKLYAGSWSDWISYADNPIGTGEK